VEGWLVLLLPQGPTQPDEVGLQVLVGAEGTFKVVGVVGGEGVVVGEETSEGSRFSSQELGKAGIL
jgi:hypothetical protein